MTCIVAAVGDDGIWMGADSAGVSGADLTIRLDPKIYRVGPALIGFTDSFRMGQLVGFGLTLPPVEDGADLMKWCVTEAVEAIRDCLRSGGYTSIVNNREESGRMLLGIKGRLFLIDSDFQVGESAEPFHAIGSGASYALGAMNVLGSFHKYESVLLALETAARFSSSVRGPFIFEHLPVGDCA